MTHKRASGEVGAASYDFGRSRDRAGRVRYGSTRVGAIPVLCHLRSVPEHVVQPKAVWPLQSNRVAAVVAIVLKPCKIIIKKVSAETVAPVTGPSGILPLGLGGEAVGPAATNSGVHGRNKALHLVPRGSHDGTAVAVVDVVKRRTAHDRCPLRLSDWVACNLEGAGYSNPCPWIPTAETVGGPHPKLSGRNGHELHLLDDADSRT